METYKLIYFNHGKGFILGEPIRFLFHAAGVQFEDIRLEEEKWLQMKSGTRWELLPMLDVNGVKISESCAVARVLARRFGLAGSNDIESAHIDEIVDVCKDIRFEWRKFVTEDKEEKANEFKKNLIENIFPKYLPKFEKLLKENDKNWLVGESYTWGDFLVVNFLTKWEETVDPQLLTNYPALQELRKAVFEIPGIKSYLEKSKQN